MMALELRQFKTGEIRWVDSESLTADWLAPELDTPLEDLDLAVDVVEFETAPDSQGRQRAVRMCVIDRSGRVGWPN